MTPAPIVLVTGVPGAGKTTLARQLSQHTLLPILSLDTVKESLYDALCVRDGLREAAWAVIVALLADCPRGAIVDVWIDPVRDRDSVRTSLAIAGHRDVVELVCRVPADLAVERYCRRRRHGVHLEPDEQTLQRIRSAVSMFSPLGLGLSLDIDTSHEVDIAAVLQWLSGHAGTTG